MQSRSANSHGHTVYIAANTNYGPDRIHPRVLRELYDSIHVPLAEVISSSLDTGELPTDWKDAHISAIYKKGPKKKAENYRPVSLTSIVVKIAESIIREEIIRHMRQNKLLSNKQFGFLRGRSTVLQLLVVLDKWTEILDQGGVIDVIYCDFMKAFDKGPHNRLLHKLQSYGISGKVLNWIRAFLLNRRQRVRVQGFFRLAESNEWDSARLSARPAVVRHIY